MSARAEAELVAAAGLGQSTKAHTIFTGFGIGLAYKTLMAALKLWKDIPEKVFGAPFKTGSVGLEISPELLGVGYIIGPRIASIMCAGGVLAYLVLIPLIKFFGEGFSKLGMRTTDRDKIAVARIAKRRRDSLTRDIAAAD